MILSEFVPKDHVLRAHAWPRRSRQASFMSKHIAEYCNCILMVNNTLANKRFNRFVQRLKKKLRLEILKSHASENEERPRIALLVNSALESHNDIKASFGSAGNASDLMWMGNVQHTGHFSETQKRRRLYDLKNNLCVVCHTKIWRLWKCQSKMVNNFDTNHDQNDVIDSMNFDDADESESENSGSITKRRNSRSRRIYWSTTQTSQGPNVPIV